MLLKRLDVTLQSFLWAERAVGREGEIATAIQSQRSALSETPRQFSLQDAFDAPASLIAECSEGGIDSSAGIFNRSLVKSVLIGPVPDRGGRASALRTKIAEKPSFKGSRSAGRGQMKTSSAPIVSEEKMEVSAPMETGVSNQTETAADAQEESPKGRKREGEHRRGHWRGKKKHN